MAKSNAKANGQTNKRSHNGGGSPKPFKRKRPLPKPEGYVFGRPTLYRPEYCELAYQVMSDGYDVAAFAGTIGVSVDTVYEWMATRSDFSEAVQKGHAARLFALQRKLLTTQIGVGVTASIFALKNADPVNWQDRYNTESTVTHNHRIEKLTDQQLEEILARSKVIGHDPTPRLSHANERQHVTRELERSAIDHDAGEGRGSPGPEAPEGENSAT